MVYAGCWLNFCINGKNWTRLDALLSKLRKYDAPTEDMAVAGLSVHTLKKVRLAEEVTLSQEGRPQIHYSTYQNDIETDVSPPILCSAYHTPRSWSEVTEETP